MRNEEEEREAGNMREAKRVYLMTTDVYFYNQNKKRSSHPLYFSIRPIFSSNVLFYKYLFC